MRTVCCLLLASIAAALSGCGNANVNAGVDQVRTQAEQLRADVKNQIAHARADFEKRRERFGRRIREVTDELGRVFERPSQTSPVVRTDGRNGPLTIDTYLTDVLKNVDAFWTQTFAQADLPRPRVGYRWIPPGHLWPLPAAGSTRALRLRSTAPATTRSTSASSSRPTSTEA